MRNRTDANKWSEGGVVYISRHLTSLTGWRKGGALWKFNGLEDTMPGIILWWL